MYEEQIQTITAQVAEALAAEPGLTVEQVILTESGGGRAQVTVGLTWQGEALSVTVEVS